LVVHELLQGAVFPEVKPPDRVDGVLKAVEVLLHTSYKLICGVVWKHFHQFVNSFVVFSAESPQIAQLCFVPRLSIPNVVNIIGQASPSAHPASCAISRQTSHPE
jgi:hypothetical protein